jgi:CRP/FNR family transcriptional regulator, cyclic AMP receptor protein
MRNFAIRLLDRDRRGRYGPEMSSFATESTLRILRQGAWFSRQPPQVQKSLASAGTIVQYDEGTWIFGETDEATGLFAVLDGFIRGYASLGRNETILIEYAGPGAWFGQVSVLRTPRRIATVLAATDATLLHIPRSALLKLTRAQPAIWEALAELSHLQMQRVITALAQKSLPPLARVAARLASLGPARKGSAAAEFRLSQSELAEMIGLERKTVQRALKKLHQRGLITTAYRMIQVLDRRGLRRIEASSLD